MTHFNRRQLLRSSLLAGMSTLGLPDLVAAQERRFQPQAGDWRGFEVTTTIEPADLQGGVQVWVPLPDVESEYQHTLGHSWSGNAASAEIVADPARKLLMLRARFEPDESRPFLRLSSRIRTRNRSVDWHARSASPEDAEALREALRPTELIPLDGIVRKTALDATRGARTDVDKVRAIYDWVISNAYREPAVRGCGNGDIKTMLETGNLGGKCADLNAVFVGLCRSSGIPARDLYGLRLVPSAFGYRELGANPAKLGGAQHCRAEVHLQGHGWVAMDPADVLKVMRQETAVWIKDPADALVAPVAQGLFGGWEGNWMAYNSAQDVILPGERGKAPLPFLMYPQGRNASGRYDEYAPEQFAYSIVAREVGA